MIKFWIPTLTSTCLIGALVRIVRSSDFCYSNSNMADARYKLFTSRMVSFYLADTYPESLMMGSGLSWLMLLTQLLHHGRAVHKEGIIHAAAYFGVVLFPTHPTKPYILDMDVAIPHYVSAGTCFICFAAYMARVIREVRYTAYNKETLDQLDSQQIRKIRLAMNLWRCIFKLYVTGLVIFFIGYTYLKTSASRCKRINTSKEVLHHFIIGEWIVLYAAAFFYAPFALLHNVDMIATGKDDRTTFQRTRTETHANELFLPQDFAQTETISHEDPGFEIWFRQTTNYILLEDIDGEEEESFYDTDVEESIRAPSRAPHHVLVQQAMSRYWTMCSSPKSRDVTESEMLSTIQE